MKVDVPRMLEALGIDVEDDRSDETWACCPFPDHEEKTASWSIRDDPMHDRHGFNYCFGCGRGGSPVDLVMEVMDFGAFSSAVWWIKDQKLDLDGAVPLAMDIELRRPGRHREVDPPFGVSDRWVTNARRYAALRGVTDVQIERWRIGCITQGKHAGRLYFPIYDRAGRLLSWTARDYTGDARAKYVEPRGKGRDGAHPGAVFGEEYWPMDRSTAELVLCEGALNALACERVGSRFNGALYGSDVTKEQLLKLKSWGAIAVASDIDKAGDKMASKVWVSLARWSNVRRVDFPQGEDPNDIERRDPAELRRRLWPDARA